MIVKISNLDNEEGFEHRYLDDVKRLRSVLFKNGYHADLKTCADIWQDYSSSVAAGWLRMPSLDTYLWEDVKGAVEELAG
jgi:hypothetical protein